MWLYPISEVSANKARRESKMKMPLHNSFFTFPTFLYIPGFRLT